MAEIFYAADQLVNIFQPLGSIGCFLAFIVCDHLYGLKESYGQLR